MVKRRKKNEKKRKPVVKTLLYNNDIDILMKCFDLSDPELVLSLGMYDKRAKVAVPYAYKRPNT